MDNWRWWTSWFQDGLSSHTCHVSVLVLVGNVSFLFFFAWLVTDCLLCVLHASALRQFPPTRTSKRYLRRFISGAQKSRQG